MSDVTNHVTPYEALIAAIEPEFNATDTTDSGLRLLFREKLESTIPSPFQARTMGEESQHLHRRLV